jgi:signal transduction histidine kinase/ActR/RegA family two-component response regulator
MRAMSLLTGHSAAPTGDPAGARHSTRAVMAMAIVAAMIVLAACGGLVWYASGSVDRITEARETRLMERSISRRFEQMRDDVASAAIWSDAYDRTARRFDPEWAQVNFGDYFHTYLHHDASFVLDARDRPIYAANEGQAVAPATLRPLIDASQGLVAAVRRESDRRLARKPNALGFDRAAAAQAAVRAGDRTYVVAASTVVPEPEYENATLPARDPVVVTAIEVGPKYLAALDTDLGLHRARLVGPDTTLRPAAWLPGATGRPVAAITWAPERPGVGVYRDARWAILGLGLLVLTAVGLVIHRLWRMAQQVVRARDRAEAGERAKSEFIANMSHEIRTPLNGVLGMAQAMESFELTPDQRERLHVIRESGQVLLTLLNDVLDLSKIEASKVVLAETPFEVGRKLETVASAFRGLAAEKGLEIVVRVDPQVAGAWIGDPLRIRQIVSNLVSNAVKFTDAGQVTLAAEPLPEGVRLTVTDTGIGFTPEAAAHLFRKFEQADASTTRRYGGTGLGLSICQGLVQLMGGRISAASLPGEGACFTVDLPLRRARAGARVETGDDPRDVAAPTPARPLRILAAEDNLTNQTVLRALIAPLGADLTLVANGREAVAAFEGGRFDVVLMDVQMPEMNGLDATRLIRRREREIGVPPTPILALTANVMSHQLDSYRTAGMDGYIAKPVDVAALYAALGSLPGDAEPDAARVA